LQRGSTRKFRSYSSAALPRNSLASLPICGDLTEMRRGYAVSRRTRFQAARTAERGGPKYLPGRTAIAQALALHPRSAKVHSSDEIEAALNSANEARIDAIYVVSSRLTVLNLNTRSICGEKSFSVGWRMGGLGQRRRLVLVRARQCCHGWSCCQLH
jgi:hypothetical protein